MYKLENKFSTNAYIELIKLFKKNGYSFKFFHENLISGKNLLNRHDIDFCPFRALKIAKIEKRLNICSTYFFLVNTEFYNLNSYGCRDAIIEIVSLGHEIGLHFDAATYSKLNKLEEACKLEKSFLEKIIKKKIKVISFHRPNKKIIGLESKIIGLNHTYMKKFVKNISYCSDSQGKWRYKSPETIIAENDSKKNFTLQLLTHPIWWTTPLKMTPAQKIEYHLNSLNKSLSQSAAKNCLPYHFYLKNQKNN